MVYACPICGSASTGMLFQKHCKCKNCGLIFFEYTLNVTDLVKIYEEKYFGGKVYRDYIQEKPFRKKLFLEKLNLIKTYMPPNGKVLDVGCATGFFLEVMRELGYETYGVEVTEYASNYARNVLKLNVITGGLLSARYPDDFFDIITMFDVLEHLPNPIETLTECSRIIKRGGILIIETLNTDSLIFKILKQNWPLFSPSYHLFYFNHKKYRLIIRQM
jgi:2-polyprenyl-3-methyl-5-hydroxy-6-metoxy-1,4-benzoquinol methylase